MSIQTIAKSILVASLSWAAFTGAAQATVYTTMDLTAIQGTSWNNVGSTPVRVDFGTGYGFGTISISSYNGGYFQNYQTPNSGESYSSLDLGGGNSLNITNESIFTIGHGGAPAGTVAGVTFTVKLDAGSFAAGTAVNIRSLDRSGDNMEFFSPGEAFAAPYAAQLPTDYNTPGAVPMGLLGSDADGDLYGAVSNGISHGLAFPLEAATDEFSFRVLSTSNFGGVAFSIALPPAAAAQVPEPETLPLTLLGLGLVGASVRRRRKLAAA